MREHLVAFFEAHHRLVEASALALLLETPEPLALSRRLVDDPVHATGVVTREMVEALLQLSSRSAALRAPRNGGAPTSPSETPNMPPDAFALLTEGFVPLSEEKDPLTAYSGLFASRFRALAPMLRGRPELTDVRPVRELAARDGTASVIVMIGGVHRSPEKHHLILSTEDESGVTDVLIPRDHPLAREAFVPDEVVGLSLQLPRERGRLPVVRRLIRPDVPMAATPRRSEWPRRVLFLSDLHIGSRSFMDEAWTRLTDFLHERDGNTELARSITQIVIAGDLVDGIGIYPNQERDLAIHDIVAQYVELGRRLAEIPRRIGIVVIPGNHDAVCPAEPQPALPAQLTRTLPPNVRPLGNPSTFSLDGVVILAYHGRSFDDLIPAIPGARYSRPTDVMKRMLEMRHLAPIYGGRTPLAALPRDGLVIDPAPDVLVTGHAHTYGADQYHGALLLNASTWQATTEYQRMRNIAPVPAHAAAVRLSDLSLTTLDFSRVAPTADGLAS